MNIFIQYQIPKDLQSYMPLEPYSKLYMSVYDLIKGSNRKETCLQRSLINFDNVNIALYEFFFTICQKKKRSSDKNNIREYQLPRNFV